MRGTHKLQPLQLDFRAGDRPGRWAGPALLVLALAFCADVLWDWQQLSRQMAQGREQLAALQARGVQGAATATSAPQHHGAGTAAAEPGSVAKPGSVAEPATAAEPVRLATAATLAVPGPGRTTAPPEELQAARETIQRIALPWERLFGALESVRSDAVTLTAIEPDAAAGRALVSGEAPDLGAVLAYLQQLRQADGLRDVHLLRHEARRAGSNNRVAGTQGGIAFTVSTAWSAS